MSALPSRPRGATVVLVHRIDGEALFLNPDLIEQLERTAGGTHVTLVDGRGVRVRESAATIAERVRDYRAAVLVEAERQASGGGASLHLAPNRER